MAQTFEIVLTTVGDDTGPFNLYSNVNGFSSPFESGISKGDLLSGYISTVVPDSASIIRIQSMNPYCSNYVDLLLPASTTTTSTSTTTTTSTTNTSSTTTTMPPIATVLFVNNSSYAILGLSISGGADIVSYIGPPIPVGANVVGYIDPVGIYDISVSGIKGLYNDIKCTFRGSNMVTQCDSAGELDGTSFNLIGTGVQCYDTQSGFSQDVIITLEDGVC